MNPLPTATLTASPGAVALGDTSLLTWSSTGADSCTASGGWSGTLAAGGTQMTGPITATTVYSLVCTGAGGDTAPVVRNGGVDSPAQRNADCDTLLGGFGSGSGSVVEFRGCRFVQRVRRLERR